MRSYLADCPGQGRWILERSSQGPSYRLVLIAAVVVFLGIGALALAAAESGQAAYPGPGERIAFVREGADGPAIFSAAADGAEEVQLTTGHADKEPTFSADGSRIAFQREGGIAVMRADGSKQQLLVAGGAQSSSATTFEENFEDPETSQVIPFVKTVTATTTFTDYSHPSFSLDRTKIAAAQAGGTEVETTTCAVATANAPDCIAEGEPGAYNPPGETQCVGCTEPIVEIDAATGVVLGDLTAPSNAHLDSNPTYAANGEIAFERAEPDTLQTPGAIEESTIYTLAADGAATEVSLGPFDRHPDFSPAGDEIVFAKELEEELGFVTGGTVTSEPIEGAQGAVATYVSSPIFSPDGEEILFTREDENGNEEIETGVYSIPSEGGEPTLVVADAKEPAWQPVVPAPEPPEEETTGSTGSTGSTTGSTGQDTTKPPATTPPPRGAIVRVKHGRVKLDGKNQATVGSVACGTSTCTIAPVSATLRVGPIVKPSSPQAIRYRATVVAPATLAAGETASVAVRVGNAGCLERLEARGTGKLRVVVRVSDAKGTHMLRAHLTLLPKS